MGKFVLEDIKARATDFVKKRKTESKLKALGATGQTLETMFRIYFYAIDGYISCHPNFWQKQAFKLYVIPGIDTDFNLIAKKRAENIASKFVLSPEDITFLKEDLKPYFEESLKKYTKKTFDMLNPMSDEEITNRIKSEYKAKRGRYK